LHPHFQGSSLACLPACYPPTIINLTTTAAFNAKLNAPFIFSLDVVLCQFSFGFFFPSSPSSSSCFFPSKTFMIPVLIWYHGLFEPILLVLVFWVISTIFHTTVVLGIGYFLITFQSSLSSWY
jgi:hypothetical protein